MFSELNSNADLLAKGHTKELAVNSLPVTSSAPVVSFEIARSTTEQLSSSMTRAAPMTLSPLENVSNVSN